MPYTPETAKLAIHERCHALIIRLSELHPHAHDTFIGLKKNILRSILSIQCAEDIPHFWHGAGPDGYLKTNIEFLKAGHAGFYSQARIYFTQLQADINTSANWYLNPGVWLLMLVVWYLSAFLILFESALVLFGVSTVLHIFALNKNAWESQAACSTFINDVEEIIQQIEVDVSPAARERVTLQQILAPTYHPQQGNTVLHVLLRFRSQGSADQIAAIKAAVLQYKSMQYERNEDHATPLLALRHSDPYQLWPLFQLDQMLDIDNTFSKIDGLLQTLKAKPKDTSRLWLFEGPAGTGKTDMITKYLGRQRCCAVEEWEVGTESDRYMGQLEARITQVFQKLKKAAKANPGQFHILYLDKMEVICPHVVSSGDQLSRGKEASYIGVSEQFQRNIEALRKETTNALVIGTTSHPLSLSPSMRNLSKRVMFTLPKYPDRLRLLKHFFIEKRISAQQIERVARLTDGWSPRGLLSIINELSDVVVSDADIDRAYNRCAEVIESDFRQVFKSAQMYLPRWNMAEAPSAYRIVTPKEIEACFKKLRDYLFNSQYYTPTPMHVLLSGPPGGGKTTAVRNFAKDIKVPFILIKSGMPEHEMYQLFEYANKRDRVLVFIDEIDQCPFLEVLQTQMDGFEANNTILIGATNHPEKIQIKPAFWSRFLFKVEVPALTEEQRGEYLSWLIHREINMSPSVSIDEALREDIECRCPKLISVTKDLDMRSMAWHLNTFFGERRSAYAQALTESSPIISLSETEIVLRSIPKTPAQLQADNTAVSSNGTEFLTLLSNRF